MRRSLHALALAALCLAPLAPLRAQHGAHETHDGDPLALGLGVIDFPTSASAAARTKFLEGVLYLHNFHYPQAIRAFQAAQQLDPGDVMAYWGEAVSYTHPVWNEQDTTRARAALRKLAPTREARLAKARTPRERAWLETAEALYGEGSKPARDTAFSAAMGRVHAAWPKDDEAAAFFALSLVGLNGGAHEWTAFDRAAAIADSVLRRRPQHPGAAHYLIHASDDPRHAPRALNAARAYGRTAPNAAHALHMTSHIFLALGHWDDVVRANLASGKAIPANSRFRYGHGTHWLVYGLAQQGRYGDAAAWLDSMQSQLPRLSDAGAGDRVYVRANFAEAAAAYVVDAKRWDAPVARVVLDTADLGAAASANLFAVGLAALNRGDRALSDSMLRALEGRTMRAWAHEQGYAPHDSGYTAVMAQVLRAMTMRADGKPDSAVAMLLAAAALETSLPQPFGPPVTIKPPREAAGELLLELGRPADARRELALALERTPRRPSVLLALARADRAVGDLASAAAHERELAAVWHEADPGVLAAVKQP